MLYLRYELLLIDLVVVGIPERSQKGAATTCTIKRGGQRTKVANTCIQILVVVHVLVRYRFEAICMYVEVPTCACGILHVAAEARRRKTRNKKIHL